ncbi:MAG TPA: PaaI family thioesterase, partial [Burkholderiaceae bacterium]|nr:PaaI family thioesterase [Burkholderiaceae bacterium]
MQTADDAYVQRTFDSFARQKAMATLGATLESVEAGRVTIAMKHLEALTQQHGFIHAGMMAAALDTACGYAAFSLMPADA